MANKILIIPFGVFFKLIFAAALLAASNLSAALAEVSAVPKIKKYFFLKMEKFKKIIIQILFYLHHPQYLLLESNPLLRPLTH